ncbi:hypothetical protein POM88_013339 [Heracleum sosnowskyi]|uniref:Uncharacterized protein n=1 Tax=Heracleum sosnowskyi TaxID=360622 RepID=A0AAD8IZP8_9APIA|nr:hypothetical protein POM88_013339 [Heracleum sosnowskyi]
MEEHAIALGEPIEELLLQDPFASYVVHCALEVSKVGFCNIIKKEKDRINHIWVVEATENSDYSLTYEHKRYIHLKHAVVASQKWAEVSSLTIEKLKQKVISIIGKRT